MMIVVRVKVLVSIPLWSVWPNRFSFLGRKFGLMLLTCCPIEIWHKFMSKSIVLKQRHLWRILNTVKLHPSNHILTISGVKPTHFSLTNIFFLALRLPNPSLKTFDYFFPNVYPSEERKNHLIQKSSKETFDYQNFSNNPIWLPALIK